MVNRFVSLKVLRKLKLRWKNSLKVNAWNDRQLRRYSMAVAVVFILLLGWWMYWMCNPTPRKIAEQCLIVALEGNRDELRDLVKPGCFRAQNVLEKLSGKNKQIGELLREVHPETAVVTCEGTTWGTIALRGKEGFLCLFLEFDSRFGHWSIIDASVSGSMFETPQQDP